MDVLLAPTTIVYPPSADLGDQATPPTTRLFSLPLARSLLLMSAIVYERSDKLVTDAVYAASKGEWVKAEDLLQRSEAKIREQAENVWDCGYEGVSDLASTSGPFASIFYERSGNGEPWIVLVFKGQAPALRPVRS